MVQRKGQVRAFVAADVKADTRKVYVTGDIHTNTIDGFLSLIKRRIGGV
jgi:hypothetical protein